MSNRKSKLFASLVSLALVIAVLAVGVWAATTQSINVTTTISFSATGVSGSISATLEGTASTQYYNSTNASGGTAITFSPSSAELADWTLGGTTPLAIGATDGVANDVVYTFTITNASTTDAIVVALNDLTVGNNLEIVSVTQDGAPVSGTTGDYAFTNIAAYDDTQIVVTVGVTDDATSITSADITFGIVLSSANA